MRYIFILLLLIILGSNADTSDSLPVYFSKTDDAILTVAPILAHYGIFDIGLSAKAGYSFPNIRPYVFGTKSIITTTGGIGINTYHQFFRNSIHREIIDIASSFSSFNLYFADTLINAMITELVIGSDWLLSSKNFGNWQPRVLLGAFYLNVNNDEHGFGFIVDGRNEYKNVYVRFPLRIMATSNGGISYLGIEMGYHILRKKPRDVQTGNP